MLKTVVLTGVLLFVCCINTLAHRKDIVVIDSVTVPASHKEALLILPGFGSKILGVKDIAAYFAHKGYDVFIPHYIGRDSLGQCVATLDTFVAKYQLLSYKKLHVFSYIAGSWILNRWLKKHPVNNVATIIYDRSPTQERAPYALVKDKPLLMCLFVGPIMKEFSETPYVPIDNDDKQIGIIIENKTTKLIRKHKRSALLPGPILFNKDSLKQVSDDYVYLCINHDEMYRRFDVIGEPVLFFIKHGHFPDTCSRKAVMYDIWDKRTAQCSS